MLLATCALRVSGTDGGIVGVAVLALTTYAAGAGVLLLVGALVLRRRWAGVGTVVLVVLLAILVLPRAVPDPKPPPSAVRTLRILAFNAYVGAADAAQVVRAVRERRVDVLVLLELTPALVERLDAAGLPAALPYRDLHPSRVGAAGSGIVSRVPLVAPSRLRGTVMSEPSATLRGLGVQLQTVHTVPPVTSVSAWSHELAQLPGPVRNGPVGVLAGDFNATLDHPGLRDLLARGWVDAGAARGAGLLPTWRASRLPLVVLTLDHVLVDPRASVLDYAVVDIAGSDHRAVYTQIALPAR